MKRCHREFWRIPPGEQLSLDLPASATNSPPSAIEIYEKEKLTADLVRNLARTLGEIRAAADLKHLREQLLRERSNLDD